MKGVLAYTEDKVVSTDFRGESQHLRLRRRSRPRPRFGTFIKLVSWYDNEWGYSCKVLEMVKVMAK